MAFAAVMVGIGVAGMLGNVASSGMDAGENASQLRTQIQNIQAQTATLKEKFNSVISQETKLDEQMKMDIVNNIDEIAKTSATARVAKRNYEKQYRQIQITGVVFVIAIFFLLLLKRLGLLDALEELLKAPFK